MFCVAILKTVLSFVERNEIVYFSASVGISEISLLYFSLWVTFAFYQLRSII